MPARARHLLVLNPTLRVAALAEVSRRGVGRRQVELTERRAVRFLLATLAGRRPRLDPALRRQLHAAGILVRAGQVPRDVHLDPRLRIAPRRLGPGCRLHRGREPFLPGVEILWMPRPGSGIMLPYTLTPPVAAAVRERLRRRLAPAGVVGESTRQRRAWAWQVRAWRRELRMRGLAVLRGLFDSTFLDAVRRYYRRLEAEGYLLDGEPRRRGSPLLYDEPLLDFLGAQLSPVVGAVTGERARSMFSFLRVYDPGARLAGHRDRRVCRWNIDLVVGGEPTPARRDAWPLWMDGRRGRATVRLGLGDGVLYRGDRVLHGRDPQPRGRTTVIGCLHYGRPARR
jgi:hypothetical protein